MEYGLQSDQALKKLNLKVMNISTLRSIGYRPLLIDFNLYTDGDLSFKMELISLIVGNVRELQQSLKDANQQNDPEVFQKTCHKVKSTLIILNDKVLVNCIEELNALFLNHEQKNEKTVCFNIMCEQIVTSLLQEGNK